MDETARQYLREIRPRYDVWKADNERLVGPEAKHSHTDDATLMKRVRLLNEYKDFIDQQQYAEKFDSRSNLHSSVLEEFMFYLFRDLVLSFSKSALIGKAHTLKDIFFMSRNYAEMIQSPNARIEIKDHDFVIGCNIRAVMAVEGSQSAEHHIFQIPAVAIECKTYLDKTMLEGSSTAAEQLANKNPNAIYIVAAEWLKLTDRVNLKKYKVNQIYVLRKQKNTDREYRYLEGYEKNPIYPEVVAHLYEYVRSYLVADWETGAQFGLERGYLL